jgi:hypothetical protein
LIYEIEKGIYEDLHGHVNVIRWSAGSPHLQVLTRLKWFQRARWGSEK